MIYSKKLPGCSIERTLLITGNKMKVLILRDFLLALSTLMRLKKLLSGVTQKLLTQQFRELEFDRIINRKVYHFVSLKVEYSLTKLGLTLKPVLDLMYSWKLL